MPPLPSDPEPASLQPDRNARSLRGRYGPLALLVALFALLDFFVPFTARYCAGPGSRGEDLGFSDESGAEFSVGMTTPASELYLSAVLIGTPLAAIAQQAVLAVWAVFGPGRWPLRFVLMIAASIGCYGLIETQLLQPVETWVDAARGLATIPLNFLAVAAPLAAWRFWSGRTLSQVNDGAAADPHGRSRNRHFSLRDLLAATAFDGLGLALARWTTLLDGASDETTVGIAYFTLAAMVWSIVYVCPLAWGLLAPRHARRAFVFGLTYTALWLIVPNAFALSGNRSTIDLGMNLGLALALTVTAPASLLVWRWCGYRLI